MKGKRVSLASVLLLTLVLFSVFLITTSKTTPGEVYVFQGSVSEGQDSVKHSFLVPTGTTKIEVTLEMPAGADFDLSLWDDQGRRTGGWTSTDHNPKKNIPNSQYSGFGKSPEWVTVDPPATTGTWQVGCYAYSESGTYKITVTLTIPPPWDFSISASPPSQTVTQGQSATYTVNVTLISGSPQQVSLSLSGQHGTMTYDFSPPSGTPTFTSTLTVSTTGSTPTGTYTLTITGTGGALTRQTTVTLKVISGPDFSISATPPSQTVSAGLSTTYTVTLTSIGGFSENVSLSVTGLPTDAMGTFDPPIVTPTGTSTLTVSTATTTPGGTYTLTITGSDGGLTHSTTVELVVVGPESFTFDVRPGATQIIVTIVWTGQGTTKIQLQNNTTTYTEADMTIYEKITVNVAEDGTRTYTGIKRALLVIAAPSTTESWALLMWLSGITTYQVNIEIA